METTHQSLCGSVYGTQTQISRKDFPHNPGVKPNIRLGTANLDVSPGFLYLQSSKGIPVGLQHFFTKPSSDLANSLILFRIRVEACQQKCTVDIRTFAFPVIPADND